MNFLIRRNEIIQSILIFGLVGSWVLYLTPGAEYFIKDPDGGFFIDGAYHLRMTGEHPQLDFFSSYGPLSFYLRAISQWAIGNNIWAEVVLVTLGYSLSFLILYEGLRRSSGSRFFALLCLAAALICLPRYYKFFVVLVPGMAFVAAMLHAEKPRIATSVVLGMCSGIALLFRHDYGTYSLLVVLVAILSCSKRELSRRAATTAALFGCSVVLIPWILFLAYHGKLIKHVIDLFIVSSSYNSGLGLPHPLLNFTSLTNSTIFALVYAIPFLLLFLVYRLSAKLDPILKAKSYSALMVSLIFLGQSAHRADIGHLFQSVGASLLGIGMAWGLSGYLEARYVNLLRGGLVVVVLLIATIGLSSQNFQYRNYDEIKNEFSKFKLSQDKYSEMIIAANPSQQVSQILQFLRCLPNERRIIIFPFAPQLAYFSKRLFAGDTLLIAPGYFDAVKHQDQMTASLSLHQPIAVLWDEAFAFDNNPLRMPIVSHNILYQYVNESYKRKGNVGGYTVFVNRKDEDGYFSKCWQ